VRGARGQTAGEVAPNPPQRRQCAAVDVHHCVIPAAGLGTRFLPATKALPKELLPVLDRPALQWGVEEAVAAGLDTMVMVIARGKELLAAHFDSAPDLERTLERRGKLEGLEAVRRAQRLAKFVYVYQAEPAGLGHAVLQARPVVGDRPFACLLPDDVSWGSRPVLAQLVEAFNELQTPVLALMRVPRGQISRYGSVQVAETRGRLHRVTAMVEKPRPEEAPSDLAIMGRYVLTPAVMEALERTGPGAGGEIQLTDGIAGALAAGEIWGLEFEGELLDVGTPEGWIKTLVRTARDHPTFGPALQQALEEYVV
jgi:UTP--glucose-1-phosphate uridylyltransferase